MKRLFLSILLGIAILVAGSPAAFAAPVSADYYNATEGSSIEQFQVRGRHASIAFPVPYFRPTTANLPMALDLFPNGTPTEAGAGGFTWIDSCAQDTPGLGANVPRTTCGRIGIRTINGTPAGYIGTVSYAGTQAAQPTPFYVQTAGVTRWGWDDVTGDYFPFGTDIYSIGNDTHRVKDIYLTDIGSLQAEIASLQAQISALAACH